MLAIEAFWLFDGSSFEWRYFILQWSKWVHDIWNKNQGIVSRIVMYHVPGRLHWLHWIYITDTLITLKTDMQTQFWFKTLIVYTYSIIYSIISEGSCIHMQSSVSCRFFVESTYTTHFVWRSCVAFWHSLVCRRGVPTGKKTDTCHERHAFMVWKDIILDAKPKMLLDEGECFWCHRSLVVFVGIFSWEDWKPASKKLKRLGWNTLNHPFLLQVVDVYGELGF